MLFSGGMEEIDALTKEPDLKGFKSVQNKRSRAIAPESPKTKKAREKLQQQWAKKELLVTESSLAQTIEKIHQWIASHATERVVLRKKTIRLFDQNQNAASLSRKVQEIAQQISQDVASLGKKI